MNEQTVGMIGTVGAELAVLAAKETAGMVVNKFKTIRTKKETEEICNSYEEIINELVAERARAIAIARAYESELQRYEITDKDIEHLQNTIGDVLDILKPHLSDNNATGLEQFKSLVSVDTLKAMQLLGFDYKRAIGDPLTDACADAIRTKLGPKQRNSARNQPQKRH